MQYSLGNRGKGGVSLLADVSFSKKGKGIQIKEEMRSSRETIQKIQSEIANLIDDKITHERPDSTALLVYFDDYIVNHNSDEWKAKMSHFINSINISWQNKFLSLYVIGASGKSFWEKIRENYGKN